MADIGIKPTIVLIGDIGEPTKGRYGPCRNIGRIGRIDGVADELVVLLLGDIDEAGEPFVFVAVPVKTMKITVDIFRKCDRKPRIAAGVHKPGSAVG